MNKIKRSTYLPKTFLIFPNWKSIGLTTNLLEGRNISLPGDSQHQNKHKSLALSVHVVSEIFWFEVVKIYFFHFSHVHGEKTKKNMWDKMNR